MKCYTSTEACRVASLGNVSLVDSLILFVLLHNKVSILKKMHPTCLLSVNVKRWDATRDKTLHNSQMVRWSISCCHSSVVTLVFLILKHDLPLTRGEYPAFCLLKEIMFNPPPNVSFAGELPVWDGAFHWKMIRFSLEDPWSIVGYWLISEVHYQMEMF